jgi:hypothetical protein
MKFTIAFTAFLLLLNLAGCKSEAEKQYSQLTDKQKEVLSVLKDVKDRDSAKAANVKLKAIAKDMTEIFERTKSIKTSADEQKQLQEKYKPELEKVSKDIDAENKRIAQIPGARAELAGGMMEIGTAALRAQMNGR